MKGESDSGSKRRAFLKGSAASAGIVALPAASAGSSEMFRQEAPGAIGRSIDSKLGDVVSVKDFGALGDGRTDDTRAIQTALDLFTSGRRAKASGSIYFPSGKYRITAPLTYGGSPQHSLTLYGFAGGARSIERGTSIYWDGNAGTSMLILNGANEVSIENINFNGASGTGIANCIHVSADNVVNTVLSARVEPGAGVTATLQSMDNIAVGMALGVGEQPGEFEVVYVTAVSAGGFTARFNKPHRAGAPVGGSAGSSGFKIRRSAISIPAAANSCGILFGNFTRATTMQVSEAACVDCYFGGSAPPGASFAGVRVVTGGNVKNFKWDNCNFSSMRRGLSIETGSGTFRIHRPIFGNLTECDIFQSGPGALFVDGAESESAAAHLFYQNGSPSAMATFIGCSWQCAAPDDDFIMVSGGSLTLIGNELHNHRTKTSVPRIKINSIGSATSRSQLTSLGNWYQNAVDGDVLFYDGSRNGYKHNSATAAFSPRLMSVGDSGGSGGPYVAITPILGYVSVPNAMLHTENCSAGLVFEAVGRVGSSTNKVVINHAAIPPTGRAVDLTVFRIPPRTKIVGVIAETTIPFTGSVGRVSLRIGTSAGGEELILEHDVGKAAVTKGLADEDLGARISRANAVQGGFIPNWSGTGSIIARFNAAGGELSGLSAGRLVIYVMVDRMA